MIKRNEEIGFDYYDQEEVPPMEGPKLWFRASDGKHFARTDPRWIEYIPTNQKFKLKVGESVEIKVPIPSDV